MWSCMAGRWSERFSARLHRRGHGHLSLARGGARRKRARRLLHVRVRRRGERAQEPGKCLSSCCCSCPLDAHTLQYARYTLAGGSFPRGLTQFARILRISNTIQRNVVYMYVCVTYMYVRYVSKPLIDECFQSQSLVNVYGDVVHVTYDYNTDSR